MSGSGYIGCDFPRTSEQRTAEFPGRDIACFSCVYAQVLLYMHEFMCASACSCTRVWLFSHMPADMKV